MELVVGMQTPTGNHVPCCAIFLLPAEIYEGPDRLGLPQRVEHTLFEFIPPPTTPERMAELYIVHPYLLARLMTVGASRRVGVERLNPSRSLW